MSYSVPPKPTPVPFPDDDVLRRYRTPDSALKSMFAVLVLPYVLLYAWWVGRKRPLLKKRPVMFRVMDDNVWRVFSDEKEAYDYAEKIGATYQGLYVRDGN